MHYLVESLDQVYGREVPNCMMSHSKSIKEPRADILFYIVVYTLLTILTISVSYPIILVLSCSFSSPQAVFAGRVILWPVDFSLEGYKAVFSNRNILSGAYNTLFYTVAGTGINLFMTILAAYPLARRNLPGRKWIMLLFMFTMFFSGGMIPNYMLVMWLGLLNTRWSLLLPGAISVYNMILMRSFMENLPTELQEAASIDGASDIRYLITVTLPLSKAIIAVLVLYYAVGHWNAYFNAMMYLTSQDKMPLQLILRDILVSNTIDVNQIMDEDTMRAKQGLSELLKYSLIVITSVPVMLIYPFIQKYFIQGVMIGSIKG